MQEYEAKKQVVQAGRELVRRGLIQRTWGNISCRIDETHFAITPSGMGYERLTPDEIVVVDCNTLLYAGNIRPSGETGIHAAVYRLYPDAGFVIHTHQNAASALSLGGYDALEPTVGEARILGGATPCAKYALPCSKRLCRNVTKTMLQTHARAIFMARHGVLAIGTDAGEAFLRAETLERVCERARKTESPREAALTDVTSLVARVHEAYPALTCVLPCAQDAIRRVAEDTSTLRPTLDDFAQLIGSDIVRVEPTASVRQLRLALRGRNAVLVRGYGALVVEAESGDAQAASYLLEKECAARLNARAYGGIKPIPLLERHKMRANYVKRYSRLK